jgi:hypothetical protein
MISVLSRTALCRWPVRVLRNELKIIWKEAVVARLRYFSAVASRNCCEQQRKTWPRMSHVPAETQCKWMALRGSPFFLHFTTLTRFSLTLLPCLRVCTIPAVLLLKFVSVSWISSTFGTLSDYLRNKSGANCGSQDRHQSAYDGVWRNGAIMLKISLKITRSGPPASRFLFSLLPQTLVQRHMSTHRMRGVFFMRGSEKRF